MTAPEVPVDGGTPATITYPHPARRVPTPDTPASDNDPMTSPEEPTTP